MKTKKINKSLSLNKATIQNLEVNEVKAIVGGGETNRLGPACMGDPYWTLGYAQTCDKVC